MARDCRLDACDLGEQLGMVSGELRLHIVELFLHVANLGQRSTCQPRFAKYLQSQALLLVEFGLGCLRSRVHRNLKVMHEGLPVNCKFYLIAARRYLGTARGAETFVFLDFVRPRTAPTEVPNEAVHSCCVFQHGWLGQPALGDGQRRALSPPASGRSKNGAPACCRHRRFPASPLSRAT